MSPQQEGAVMPVYRLEPLEGMEGHSDWRASHIIMAVWLRAHDPEDARKKMALATATTLEGYEVGQLIPYSPWLNSAVVSCDEDDSRDVPDGVVVLGNGKTIAL
jgi:hypothetical protein